MKESRLLHAYCLRIATGIAKQSKSKVIASSNLSALINVNQNIKTTWLQTGSKKSLKSQKQLQTKTTTLSQVMVYGDGDGFLTIRNFWQFVVLY